MSNLSSVIKSIQDVMRQDSGVDGDAQRISQLTWLLFLKVFDALEEEMELTRDSYTSPIPEAMRWRNWAADAEGITGETLLAFVNNELFTALKNLRGDAQRNTLARPLRDYTPAERVDVVLTNPPFGGVEEPGIEQGYPADVRTKETADLFLVLIKHILKTHGRAALVLPDGTLLGEGVKTRIKEQLLNECNLHTIVRLRDDVHNPDKEPSACPHEQRSLHDSQKHQQQLRWPCSKRACAKGRIGVLAASLPHYVGSGAQHNERLVFSGFLLLASVIYLLSMR